MNNPAMNPDAFLSTYGWVGLAIALFALLVMILWVLLPFAVFGIKKRLDEIIVLSRNTNKQLSKLNDQLIKLNDTVVEETDTLDKPVVDEIKPRTPNPVEPPPTSPVPPKPGVQVCDNCGQKNSSMMTNCTRCGASLKREPSI